MSYRLTFKPRAEKAVMKLPRGVRERVMKKVRPLRDNPLPPGAKKLKARESMWRLRVGDYRIVYEIQDDELIVLVLRVGHRKDVYRGLG